MNIAVVPAFAGGVLEGVARALRVAPPSEWPAELVEQITQVARGAAQRLHLLRPDLERAAHDGFAAHVVVSGFPEFLALTEYFSSFADQLRQAEAASVALPPGTDACFAAVWALLDEFDWMHRLLAPIVARLQTPPPPIDAARLEAGREAIRQGDFRVYSDADDMVRDLAGG